MATPPVFTAGQILTAAQMNQIGLFEVASGTLATATTDFVGCFTDDYRDYRIMISNVAFSGTGELYFRMLNASSPDTTGNYFWALNGLTIANAATNSVGSGQTLAATGIANNGANGLQACAGVLDVRSPKLAQRTLNTSQAMGVLTDFYHRTGFSAHNVTTAFDGIRFLTNSAVTVTGNVQIYGYRN
jgi:hypothetical protein